MDKLIANAVFAVNVDLNQAKIFLKDLGFEGITYVKDEDNRVEFQYKFMYKTKLDQDFGLGKLTPKGLVFWKYGTSGFIIVNPRTKSVILKNANQNPISTAPIVTPAPTPTGVDSPNIPGSKENDNSQVPVVHINNHLHELYKYTQSAGSAAHQLAFMKKLWHYFNSTKFNDDMVEPNFRLLKNQSAQVMRLRGRWWPHKRLLEVAPRLFNATQNFFVEVFLHEMCHQAVSEIDRVHDRSEGGHGPDWRKWMRLVGLNPLRFDPNDNSVYYTKQEKEALERRRQSLKRLPNPEPYMQATVIHNGVKHNGILACEVPDKKIWTFIDENANLYGRFTVLYVFADNIYQYEGKKPASFFDTPAFEAAINTIQNKYY